MRIPEADIALIDRAAAARGLSRTDFVREGYPRGGHRRPAGSASCDSPEFPGQCARRRAQPPNRKGCAQPVFRDQTAAADLANLAVKYYL